MLPSGLFQLSKPKKFQEDSGSNFEALEEPYPLSVASEMIFKNHIYECKLTVSYNYGFKKHFRRVLEQEQSSQSASPPALSPELPPNTQEVTLGDSQTCLQPCCAVLGLAAAAVGAQRGGQ